MTKVKMKAVDTLHVTSAGAENIEPGGTFEVNKEEADQLEKAGLATPVSGTKAEAAAPANKAEKAAPENKGIISASAFDHDGDGKPGGSARGVQSTRAKGAAKRKGG